MTWKSHLVPKNKYPNFLVETVLPAKLDSQVRSVKSSGEIGKSR